MEIIQFAITLMIFIGGAFAIGYELGKFTTEASAKELIDRYRKRIKIINEKILF